MVQNLRAFCILYGPSQTSSLSCAEPNRNKFDCWHDASATLNQASNQVSRANLKLGWLLSERQYGIVTVQVL